MEKLRRLPRPMGTTSLMVEYHRQKDPETLKKVRDYLINQWLLNNGNLCGINYGTNELAQFLGVDPEYIRLNMRDRILNSRIWDKDQQEKLLYGLYGEQLMWAMEDRMEIASQVAILRQAQGNKYVPYLTAELNKALKLRLDSSSSLQTLIKNLTGGGTTNIFNQINSNNQIVNQEFITLDKAREIIAEEAKPLTSPEEAKLLETKYDIKDLPQVVAYDQGLKATDGSKLNTNELNEMTDNYKNTVKEFPNLHHEMRREIEERIDPDSPDPELDIYIPELDEDKDQNLPSIGETFLNEKLKW